MLSSIFQARKLRHWKNKNFFPKVLRQMTQLGWELRSQLLFLTTELYNEWDALVSLGLSDGERVECWPQRYVHALVSGTREYHLIWQKMWLSSGLWGEELVPNYPWRPCTQSPVSAWERARGSADAEEEKIRWKGEQDNCIITACIVVLKLQFDSELPGS